MPKLVRYARVSTNDLDVQLQHEKASEIKKSSSLIASFAEDIRLAAIEAEICEKGALIDHLTKSIYNHSTEEEIAAIREKIIIHKEELKILWDKQFSIEQEVEQQLSHSNLKYCA